MNTCIDTLYKDNCRIEIYPDNDPINPREWDNLGIMVCQHRNYNLGDVQIGRREKDKPFFYDTDDFFQFLKENKGKIIALPLYLYDHSGISMSTRSFVGRAHHAEWDSGQVGYIYVTYETIRKEYNWQIITKERKQKIIEYLKSEVSVYDDYLTGNVYGYQVYCQECDEEIDSCWGFYGSNWKENGLLDQADTECKDCKDKVQSGFLQSVYVTE